MTRRGWATTEFWTTVLVAVGSLAASLVGDLPPRYASIASAIAVGAYAIARGLAKLGPVPTAPPAAPAAAPSVPAAPAPAAVDAPPAVVAPPDGTP